MKNIIKASIEFYYKGEKYSPSITVEIDKHLESNGSFPNFCSLIAIENNIDLYSYEYEMMQAEDIKFTHIGGFVENFITNEQLKVEEFEAAWQEQHALAKLLGIAEEHMNITDLEQHIELKQALLAAYQLGKLESK